MRRPIRRSWKRNPEGMLVAALAAPAAAYGIRYLNQRTGLLVGWQAGAATWGTAIVMGAITGGIGGIIAGSLVFGLSEFVLLPLATGQPLLTRSAY